MNSKKNIFKKSAKALVLSTAFASILAVADPGSLRITVTDSNGNPVAGAQVNASTSESLTSRTGTTDAQGMVRLIGLDPSNKYELVITSDNYQTSKSKDVLVASGKTFSLAYALSAQDSGNLEEVFVTGESVAMVDTSVATTGIDLGLDLTESLPTARSYQSYLQLVPGVKPSANGNPSSKSGVNYSDVVRNGSTSGSSTDNLYYIDGVDVTDNSTGTFGSNINSEIIQELSVITGAIPAQYAGASGLLSRVITKSGGDEFSGSLNYYLQNDSLVADNDNLEGADFSDFDTAFTLGGPIIKEKLWFFLSHQILERKEDIVDPNTNELLREVTTDQSLTFAKLTWQPTDADKLVVTFFDDPFERDGSDDITVPGNRDRIREQGGDNYHLQYSHAWDNVVATLDITSHEGQVSDFSKNGATRNDVAFLGGSPTNAQLNVGGFGQDSINFRNRDEIMATVDYFLDTDFGTHDIKFGYSMITNENQRNLVFTGDGSQYTSISTNNSGATLDSYVSDSWTGTTDLVNDDFARILTAIDGSSAADQAFYLGLLDSDNNGDISDAELGALTFGSTAGNPEGNVNVYRIAQVETAPIKTETEGTTIYIQDKWNMDKWTVQAGLRAEEWAHFATDGSKIFTFDFDIAHRLSVAYDIFGDGQSAVSLFSGRYYDPIRTNMTNFAGTLTGSVREEQVFVGDRWLTYRTRGGSQVQDAFFAPSTKTPYTDEIQLKYVQALTDDMSIEVLYTDRETNDVLEDYDLGVYTDPAISGDLSLPLSYFGYDSVPDSNFVIATLAGGKREYQGLEVTFRKRRSDNWQMIASYTNNQAKGSSNSDSNADFQGDVLFLDPRAPNVFGKQPGNIEHQFRVYGSYFFDNGIELGAVYNWNSGLRYSRTFAASGRHLPVRVDAADAYEFGGVTARWLQDDAVGSQTSSSYGTLDLRVKYTHDFGKYQAEFFVDLFNALDDQAVIQEQDLVAGDGSFDFGEGVDWVEPRRFFLGARVSF